LMVDAVNATWYSRHYPESRSRFKPNPNRYSLGVL
jgi:hypothetical protein